MKHDSPGSSHAEDGPCTSLAEVERASEVKHTKDEPYIASYRFVIQPMGLPKKLLVLDVNGLLLHRMFNADPESLPCAPDKVVGEFTIFLRPNVRDFIRWCSERFVIVIWSTAQKQNVVPLVDMIFSDTTAPLIILDQSHCTDTGLKHSKKPKPLWVKLLDTVWEHPDIRALGKFGPENTLLLDDTPCKAAWNPPHTAVHPREWKPGMQDPVMSDALGEHGSVRQLLDDFSRCKDGREVVKQWNSTTNVGWTLPEEDEHWKLVSSQQRS